MKKRILLITFSLFLASCSAESLSDKLTDIVDKQVEQAENKLVDLITEETDFAPIDSSDETIESIRTHRDYYIMTEFIVNEYYQSAKELYHRYGLESTIDEVTSEAILEDTFEESEILLDTLLGSDLQSSMVEYLKEYRDELQHYLDELEASLS